MSIDLIFHTWKMPWCYNEILISFTRVYPYLKSTLWSLMVMLNGWHNISTLMITSGFITLSSLETIVFQVYFRRDSCILQWNWTELKDFKCLIADGMNVVYVSQKNTYDLE